MMNITSISGKFTEKIWKEKIIIIETKSGHIGDVLKWSLQSFEAYG